MKITFQNGSALALDLLFQPMGSLNPDGNPMPLSLSSNGARITQPAPEPIPSATDINGTAPVTGAFQAGIGLKDRVAAFVSSTMTGTLTALDLSKGVTIPAFINSTNLASGSVLAIHA